MKIAPIIRERLVTFDDAVELTSFFFQPVTCTADDMIGKNMTREETLDVLKRSFQILKGYDPIRSEEAEPPMRKYVEESGYSAGQVFGILRVAITGQKVSPPLFESMEILGSQRVVDRLAKAIYRLENA
jgi:glutamyl-tRNA synthetase